MFYDIYLYTLYYYICCLLGACMRCTWLCFLKSGVTKTPLGPKPLDPTQITSAFHGLQTQRADLWAQVVGTSAIRCARVFLGRW
jgi:hypothetical protein